jgi:hypothetical protein
MTATTELVSQLNEKLLAVQYLGGGNDETLAAIEEMVAGLTYLHINDQ